MLIRLRKKRQKDYLLKQLKQANVSVKDLIRFYSSCIRSVLEYFCQVFHSNLPKYLSDDIERIKKRAMRMVFPDLPYNEACLKANLPNLVKDVICYHKTYLIILLETKTNICPILAI